MQNLFGEIRSRGRLIALIIVGVACVAALIFIITRGPRGTLTLTVPGERSQILIDNEVRGVTKKADETLTFRLAPGEHEIIISRDGHWPWFKNINVVKNESLAFTSFTVPTDSNPGVVPEGQGEYTRIATAFRTLKVPTRENPSLASDQKTAMWVNPDNNGVYVEWLDGEESLPEHFCELGPCDTFFLFFNAQTEIYNASFLKGRNDTAIIATGAGVYLIEITKMPFQNFQPLYVGTKPQFDKRDESSIYIYDNKKLMVVSL